MFKNLLKSLTHSMLIKKDVEKFVKENDFSKYPLFQFNNHCFNLEHILNKGLIEYSKLKEKEPVNADRLRDRAIEDISRMIHNEILDIGKITKELTKMTMTGEYCFSCGKHHSIELNSEGVVSVYGRSTSPKNPIINEQCAFTQPIARQDIVLKTGNLIISDYFRIKKDTLVTIVEKKMWSGPDLNCAQGEVDEFNLYFQKNIIKVQCGSGGLDIVEYNGNLYFGYAKEECEKKVKVVGHVSHDLWATCVTEKENLIELLKTNNIKFDSVSKMNEEISDTVQASVKIEPGLFTVVYSPQDRHSLIEDEFEQNFSSISFKLIRKKN